MDEFSCYLEFPLHTSITTYSVPGILDVSFYLPEESGYANQKYDVTNTEIEDILPEWDVAVEGELETTRCDVDLEEFFNYIVQNEGLSHPPWSWRKAKRNFEKIMTLCS